MACDSTGGRSERPREGSVGVRQHLLLKRQLVFEKRSCHVQQGKDFLVGDLVPDAGAFPASDDHAAAPQGREVLRDIGLLNANALLELADSETPGGAQCFEDADAHRVSQSTEELSFEVLERELWAVGHGFLTSILAYSKIYLKCPAFIPSLAATVIADPDSADPSHQPPGWASRLPGHIRQDILAGIVVGVIACPLSIALAVAVGVAPITGLYTAVFAGAVAAIFGGSRFNITGPTAALVPVLGHVVLRHGPEALPLLALMSGLMLVGLSLLGAGRLVRYIPGPVVVGFTAGIALSIAFGQLNGVLGVQGTDPSLEHFHARTFDTLAHVSSIGWASPAIGLASLCLLIAWPRLPRVSVIPGPLVAVVASTAVTWTAGIDLATIGSKYGELPRDLPTPSLAFIDLGLAIELLPVSVSVAVLAGIESLLSAVVADGMANTAVRHEPDRELRGQGLANIVVGFMAGIPATAAIARTAAGIRNGATSRLTGVVHALTVLAATVVFAGLAGHVPLAALAAILLVIAWNIAEVPELSRLVRRAPREDAAVLIATAGITLFFDLSYAIAFGVLASMVLLIRRFTAVPSARALLPDDAGRIRQVSPELSELIRSRPDIDFFTVEGQLSFHSAAAFEFELRQRRQRPLILRMKDVHHIDASGLLMLEGIIEHRESLGGRTILTAIQPELRPSLARFGILELLGPGNVFEHTRCAIAAIDQPGEQEADVTEAPAGLPAPRLATAPGALSLSPQAASQLPPSA